MKELNVCLGKKLKSFGEKEVPHVLIQKMLKDNVKNCFVIWLELVETCPCTEADWECDFGYYRKIDGGECIP